jgi:hypothetical protein
MYDWPQFWLRIDAGNQKRQKKPELHLNHDMAEYHLWYLGDEKSANRCDSILQENVGLISRLLLNIVLPLSFKGLRSCITKLNKAKQMDVDLEFLAFHEEAFGRSTEPILAWLARTREGPDSQHDAEWTMRECCDHFQRYAFSIGTVSACKCLPCLRVIPTKVSLLQPCRHGFDGKLMTLAIFTASLRKLRRQVARTDFQPTSAHPRRSGLALTLTWEERP